MESKTFVELGLSESLLQAVADAKYVNPTPIQSKVIPSILEGRDVFGCAQTGTGKTASFTLPMIDKLSTGRARARMPRSLIIVPTRELATQVRDSFDTYSKHSKLKQALLIGGESMSEQEKTLARSVDVLIATPGRLIDLFERGKILLTDIKILVIDEADRMLDMGFIPDVERIVSLLPKSRQTLFFSATMPNEIRRLSQAFLTNPVEVIISPPRRAATTIKQYVVQTTQKDKRKDLRDILSTQSVQHAIIFCNRKRDATNLCTSLKRYDYNVGLLHGDLAQSKRTETLNSFKKGDISILVASDVAARGIDIESLSHVINFDVPFNVEDYIHRIGRTGRAGQGGVSLTLLTPEETVLWGTLSNHLKTQIFDYDTGQEFNLTPGGKQPLAGKKPSNKTTFQPTPAKQGGKKPLPKAQTAKAANHVPIPEVEVLGFGDNIPEFLRQSK